MTGVCAEFSVFCELRMLRVDFIVGVRFSDERCGPRCEMVLIVGMAE